jgi:hypothetical protein
LVYHGPLVTGAIAAGTHQFDAILYGFYAHGVRAVIHAETAAREGALTSRAESSMMTGGGGMFRGKYKGFWAGLGQALMYMPEGDYELNPETVFAAGYDVALGEHVDLGASVQGSGSLILISAFRATMQLGVTARF